MFSDSAPQDKTHYFNLLQAISIKTDSLHVVHCWLLDTGSNSDNDSILERGAYSLLYVSQKFAEIFPGKKY